MDHHNKTNLELLEEIAELRKNYHALKIQYDKDFAQSKALTGTLEESERKFKMLTENMMDIIWEVDLSLRIKYISPSVEKNTGFSPSEMTGQNLFDFIETDSSIQLKSIYASRIQAYKNTGELKSAIFEHRQICKNGEFKWFEALSNPIFGENNDLIGFQGISRDISDWKMVNDRVKESENRLSKVFHASPYAISILRISDQQLIDVNNVVKDYIGYTREEILANKKLAISIWTNKNQRDEYFDSIFKGKQLRHFEMDFRTKEGKTGSALMSTEFIEIDNQPCVIGFFEVITAHKQAEEKLIESEKLFRSIFENSRDAIFWADATTGEIINCNHAAELLIERDVKEIIGKHHTILHPSETHDHNKDDFKSNIESEKKRITEALVITKKGKIKTVEVTSTVINVGKRLINQGIFKDISERKRMEIAIQNIAATSSLSAEKDIFSILVVNLSQALQVKYAFIGHFQNQTKEKIRTIAACREQTIIDNFEYKLCGTPCEMALQKGVFSVSDNISSMFPEDNMLRTMHVKAYSGISLKNKNNENIGIIAVLHDQALDNIANLESIISLFAYRASSELERKRIDEALLETQANLLAIVENTNDSIWAVDTEYKLIFLNQQFKHEFKKSYEVELTPGISILEVLPPSVSNSWKERYDRALANEQFEFEEHFNFGEFQYYVEIAMNPIISENEIIGVSVFARNITNRKLAEFLVLEKSNEIKKQNDKLIEAKENIRISERTYRGILDSISEAVYIQNMDGSFLEVNHSAENLYGYKRDEFIGKNPEFLSAPGKNNLSEIAEMLKKVQEGEAQRFEFWGKHKNGSIFPKEVNCTLGYYFGKPVIIAVAREISERKHAEMLVNEKNKEIAAQNEEYHKLNEELLQANEDLIKAKVKAEESDRLKTSFLQNMSHEIRTPMNAIMGFSSLLADQYNNKSKLEQYSTIIKQRCIDLLDIINDILDIAKIESGQVSINLEVCNISHLFKELQEFFREQQKRTGKEQINFSLKPMDVPSENMVMTDKGKLKQILINLINNAFKFTNQGIIEGGYKHDNDQIIFYVRDTGIGIAPDKHDLVFERFVQLNQNENSISSGTGLGLSIVKGLVDLLNGSIWLESIPGKGTTFYFTFPYLPVIADKEPDKSLKETKITSFEGSTILIVEDDIYNAEFLEEVIRIIGFRIFHAKSGSEAIRIVSENQIDIILMDIRLPDINGYDLTIQIKKLKPEIKIIAQTAYAGSEDNKKAMLSGCDDYVSKPINHEVLIEKISRQLDSK